MKQCLLNKRQSPSFAIAPLILYDKIVNTENERSLLEHDVNLKEDFSKSKENELVALGALDKIMIVQIKPKPMEL